MDKSIKRIIDNSEKADLLEKVNEILALESGRAIFIYGKPDGTEEMIIGIRAIGFNYDYETWGFMREAGRILDNALDDNDELIKEDDEE